MARPRVDATITEQQLQALQHIASETGQSRSEVVSEAISLFTVIFMEAKRGHRLVSLDPANDKPARDLVSPTLSSLEWTRFSEALALQPDALEKVKAVIDAAAEPTETLRDAMAKRSR